MSWRLKGLLCRFADGGRDIELENGRHVAEEDTEVCCDAQEGCIAVQLFISRIM